MSTYTYNVTGMSCGHCENAVKEEVANLPGVTNIEVSAEKGLLTFEHDDAAGELSDQQVIDAVDEAGYEATRRA
ncbi:heavy-metal-associated domain-containing protein [Corynebacterium sp. YSMAA1_1_F7]|uniref:heavy-metal-associated domain-containing protein n=1 Tax=Corynebacterium sp. YSMAA1_1_F7 TaxID=3383590 RepID=UPI0038CFB9F8